jgi:hypothetical protein
MLPVAFPTCAPVCSKQQLHDQRKLPAETRTYEVLRRGTEAEQRPACARGIDLPLRAAAQARRVAGTVRHSDFKYSTRSAFSALARPSENVAS